MRFLWKALCSTTDAIDSVGMTCLHRPPIVNHLRRGAVGFPTVITGEVLSRDRVEAACSSGVAVASYVLEYL